MSKLIQLKDDNGENLYPVIYGKVLYENDNGNTGNITLNDYIYNYKYIKVYGKNGNPSIEREQSFVSQEFYTNYQNQFECQFTFNTNGNGIVYCCGVYYYMNGKSMTIEWAYRCGLYGTNQGYIGTNNFFAVQKIIGYK